MVQPYVSGQHVEDRLVVRLKLLGCQLQQSEELNHVYKLDFIVTAFEGIGKLRPVGVQVTTRTGDRVKMREFLVKQRQSAYVDKTLYVELQHHGIEQGVDRLVYSSVLQFLFSASFSGVAVGALRVRPDFTVEFFDLEAECGEKPAGQPVTEAPRRFESLPPTPATPDLPLGSELAGFIRVVFAKGYGFIDCEPHPSHFFPFAKVVSPPLKEYLQGLQRRANPSLDGLHIPVKFVSLGKTRAGEKASPQADRIDLNGEIPKEGEAATTTAAAPAPVAAEPLPQG